MNKYVLKFRKEGYIKYISHLDLVRLFHRSFKMTNLHLNYSLGFNPHPKMSFVQPLSLGYSSRAELLEFELQENLFCNDIISKLNSVLPDGIEVLDCKEFHDNKTLSSNVISSIYNIYFPTDISLNDFSAIINSYMVQSEINTIKKSKKKDEVKSVNIKPMIRNLECKKLGDYVVIKSELDSGSTSNLSPELLISSILSFSKININRYDIEVERLEIKFSSNFQI